MMLTLTVDPKRFGSPDQALAHVRDKRAISVLMQKLDRRGCLHTRRYFYVIEWHKSGWPHWHVLVDASFIPHDLLSQAWGLGFTLFSAPKFADHQHAANYACKYIIKHPEEGFPDWVLDSTHVHRYGHSRGLLPVDGPSVPCDVVDVPGADEGCPAWCFCEVCRGEVDDGEKAADDDTSGQPRKTVRQRIAACGTRAVIIATEDVDLGGGEFIEQRRFVAELPWTWEEIAAASCWEPSARGMRIDRHEAAALVAGKLPWQSDDRPGANRQNEAIGQNVSSASTETPTNPCVGTPDFFKGDSHV